MIAIELPHRDALRHVEGHFFGTTDTTRLRARTFHRQKG
jgi:hypothetical protein